MGFRGESFAFESPAAAVAGMVARLGAPGQAAGELSPTIRRPVERVALAHGLGRVLAEDARSDRDSPAFDHSAMDGYAVRAAEVIAAARSRAGPVTLRVVGESRIGCEPPALPESADTTPRAVRIATGAPIPHGADAIVKREDVTEHAESEHGVGSITLAAGASAAERIRPGDHVRRRGENAPRGAVMLAAGTVLHAAALGTLAAVGVASLRVLPRLRVRVITTGDEVVPPEALPDRYEIRNSNATALVGMLAARRWIEAAHAAHVRDAGPALRDALRASLDAADAVILTGGVSMGHRDPVRAGVDGVGASVVFHGLPQRPGKPMLGAIVTRADGACVPILGLPGNPVSALVTCTRIVVPVLAACAGVTHPHASLGAATLVRLTNPDGKELDLWWHRLVRLAGDGNAELVDGKGSGDIIAGGRSDGFVEVPPKSLAGGPAPEILPFYPWAGNER